jgi:hypothetical protein
MHDHPSIFHLSLPKPGRHNMVCFESKAKKPVARANPIPSGMKAPATKLPIGMVRLETR